MCVLLTYAGRGWKKSAIRRWEGLDKAKFPRESEEGRVGGGEAASEKSASVRTGKETLPLFQPLRPSDDKNRRKEGSRSGFIWEKGAGLQQKNLIKVWLQKGRRKGR